MRKTLVLVLSSICLVAPFVVHADACVVGDNKEAILAEYLGKIVQSGQPQEKSMVNLLINQQETTDQRKGLIYHFCDTVLKKRVDANNKLSPALKKENVQDMEKTCFEYDGFKYDPNQSLFLYTLCVHTEAKNKDTETYPTRDYKKEFPVDTYIEEGYDFNQLREISDQHDCSPTISMQGCQFSRFLPKLFGNVMNTYTNMKLASLYGYKYITEDMGEEQKNTKIQEAIQDFSDSYFQPPAGAKDTAATNECGESGVRYLRAEPLEGDKKHCSHPKTNAMMAETIKSAQALIKKIDRLEADKVISDPAQSIEMCLGDQRNNNLMYCAFSNHGDYFVETDWSSFQNLYLNELMFFSLFVEYYTNQVIDKVSYNPFTVGSYSHSSEKNAEEFRTLVNELSLHQEATFQSMRLLSQIYIAYPLHVSMMAYLEDLQLYRKELAKLYTPLNQLYYLFRNVQACQD